METYSINVLDKDHKKVGQLMTATDTEILKFINKGFFVEDMRTGQEITESSITTGIGVSDGLINIG